MNGLSKRQPLPDSWVERIFDRMHGLYGSLWVDRWRTGEMVERNGRQFDRGLLLAKATWADELAGFADKPERIARALEVCRHRKFPPTVPEFLEECREQFDELQRLPAPKLDKEEVAPHIEEMMRKAFKSADKTNYLGWAKNPPPKEHRARWAAAICDCLESGDGRFRKILSDHVRDGVIVSPRAKALLSLDEEHDHAA